MSKFNELKAICLHQTTEQLSLQLLECVLKQHDQYPTYFGVSDIEHLYGLSDWTTATLTIESIDELNNYIILGVKWNKQTCIIQPQYVNCDDVLSGKKALALWVGFLKKHLML